MDAHKPMVWRNKKTETNSSLWYPVRRQEAMQWIYSAIEETPFHYEKFILGRKSNTGKVAQSCFGVFILGDTENLRGHSPEKPAVSWLCPEQGLTRQPPKVPSNLNTSVILWLPSQVFFPSYWCVWKQEEPQAVSTNFCDWKSWINC